MAAMKRPTLKDIAAVAGVSHATVSLALNKNARIPLKTRERIEKIAREIGYHPDPALTALSVYRRGVRNVKYEATLAWINFHRQPVEKEGVGYIYEIYQGAKQRCLELGYTLEEFMLKDMDMNFGRLSEVLYARGIQGVLFAPQARTMAHISTKRFAWEEFSSISFGFTLVRPKLDVVIDAQYRGGRLTARKMKALGYRRIGAVASEDVNERTDGNFLAGYLYEQLKVPLKERIPPFIHQIGNEEEGRQWFRKYKPDAIIDVGRRVPFFLTPKQIKQIGYASPGISEHERGKIAGVYQNMPRVGRVGVNEVVALIHTNRRGIPEIPLRILVEGDWVDAPSAPRVNHR